MGRSVGDLAVDQREEEEGGGGCRVLSLLYYRIA